MAAARPSSTSPAHRALSDRLKAQFQDPDSDDDDANASQDWFVNDVREATPVKDNTHVHVEHGTHQEPAHDKKPPVSPSLSRKHSSFSETEETEAALVKTKTGFMHLRPLVPSVLIMELCKSDATMAKHYGTKYFKIYLPQIVDSQVDFCLVGRKRPNKNKIRFSLSETNMSKWSNPSYVGKLSIYKTPRGHKFKIVCPKRKQRTVFTIEQDNRKVELVVHFHVQHHLAHLFQLIKPPSTPNDPANPPTVSCLLQKFINPVADVRASCSATPSLLQIDREGVRALRPARVNAMIAFDGSL
ncbi:hypothetical protein, variant 1 [Aphanomyces invadans]|uniref:Uncharacterized protein n=1 Tax=Aphanomyces invadans TaxID=157072 RepID=A0A024TNF0_9STRA|nr:hypothetical protein, variant 1 [Aphanomyces invadans]ETV95680.1 hypothetical protein, variant 1 [Aphanomyces invadans]|eukprot:XP_008875873.1 hypothetical protein, variant 1 [Aphanomyces invadans]